MENIDLKEAMKIAGQDPKGMFALSLKKTIESGELDNVAFDNNIDLSMFGRPKSKPLDLNPITRLGSQIKDIPQDIQKTGQNIASTFSAGKERVTDAMTKGITGEQGLGSATFQAIGEGARTGAGILGDLFIGGASLITTPQEEQAFQDKLVQGVQALGKTDVGKGVAELADQYNTFKEANPEIAGNLEASLGFAEAVLEVTGAGAGLKATKKGLKATGEAIGEGFEQGIKKVDDVVSDIKIPELNADNRTIDKIVGEITQEKDPTKLKSNIEVLNKVVNDIEVGKDITVSDLRSQIKAKQKSLMSGVDNALGVDKTPYKADQLTKVTKGKTGDIISRPVEDALAQLDEIYRATGDDIGLDEITFIKNKLDAEGLTRKEVNDLARLYGKDVSKGFTKLGAPTTSVTGQATENTRKKLKSVVREGLDDTAKEFDSLYGKTVTLDKSLEKFDKAVQNLTNKTVERGVIENLTNQGAKLANLMSGGALKGAISGLLQSNVGGKTMNALALQEALAKNLKQLQKLNTIDKVKDVVKKADIINDVAKTLSKEKGFGIIDDTFLDTDKIVKDIGKRIKDTPNKQGGFVKVGLDKTDDLVEQAKKFDNVDEFVESQDLKFHGTNVDFDKFDIGFVKDDNLGKGFYFADNVDIAKSYAKKRTSERGGTENIIEAVIDYKKPFIPASISKKEASDFLKIENPTFSKSDIDSLLKDSFDELGDYSAVFPNNYGDNADFLKFFKKNNYDSLIIEGTDKVTGRAGTAIVVTDPSLIKTKSQLTEIFNQAKNTQ